MYYLTKKEREMFTISEMENELSEIAEKIKSLNEKSGYGYYLSGKKRLLEEAIAERKQKRMFKI